MRAHANRCNRTICALALLATILSAGCLLPSVEVDDEQQPMDNPRDPFGGSQSADAAIESHSGGSGGSASRTSSAGSSAKPAAGSGGSSSTKPDAGSGGSSSTKPDAGSSSSDAGASKADAGTCVPDCKDAECGSDGCGGSCGTCASSDSCKSGACVANATCGDGTCNGTETKSTCCKDCGCSGDNVCRSNACEPPCESTTFHIQAAPAVNQVIYSPVCGTNVTAVPRAFLTDLLSGTWIVPGTFVSYEMPLGDTRVFGWDCCTLDTSGANCLGYSNTCRDGNNFVPCVCNSHTDTLTADSCDTKTVSICN